MLSEILDLNCFFMPFQFLQDILDTLFVVLDDNTEKYGLLVFQSLVSNQLD